MAVSLCEALCGVHGDGVQTTGVPVYRPLFGLVGKDYGRLVRGRRAIVVFALFASSAELACGSSVSSDVLEATPQVGTEPSAAVRHARAEELLREGRENAEQAAQLFELACRDGHMRACVQLGDAYTARLGVPTDGAKARTLFDRACDGGDLLGCARGAEVRLFGLRGARHDLRRAYQLANKACSGNALEGCDLLSRMLLSGAGVKRDVKRSMQVLEDACEANKPSACNLLGRHLERGASYHAFDVGRAVRVYTRACKADEPRACANLAHLYLRGYGVVRDVAESHRLHAKACALHDVDGCTRVALDHLWGHGVERSLDLAVRKSGQACRNLSARACRHIAAFTQQPATARLAQIEKKQSVTFFRRRCEAGEQWLCRFRHAFKLPQGEISRSDLEDAEVACRQEEAWGCNRAGWAYEWGSLWTPPNAALAALYYERACDGGDVTGCVNWGYALQRGFGVAFDLAGAVAFAASTCLLKNKYGCNNLASMTRFGRGVPKDLDDASVLFAQACANENEMACFELGVMQYERTDPSPQLKAAHQAFLRACEVDHGPGCGWAGRLFLTGEAGQRGEAVAREYFEKSCRLGYHVACGDLNQLEDAK